MNKDLQNFAQNCVNQYAKYGICDQFYNLEASDLPDFIQHEFAALIIAHNESYAQEATGPDNQYWDTKMLPALNRYLANSTDKDTAIEFNNTWRDCVTSYVIPIMQELIEDALYNFNEDHGYIKPESYYYGISAHGSM